MRIVTCGNWTKKTSLKIKVRSMNRNQEGNEYASSIAKIALFLSSWNIIFNLFYLSWVTRTGKSERNARSTYRCVNK